MTKIQYIKAFFNPNKHEAMIREHLVTKTALEHNDFMWMKGSYEDMFMNENGIISFWYDRIIKEGKTTGAMFFRSIDWYKLVLQGKIRKFVRVIDSYKELIESKIRRLLCQM